MHGREAQLRQKRNYDKDAVHMHPFKQGDEVLVSVKVIPRGGVGKLLRSWRGPFKIQEVRQDGRWYILDTGLITHYEKLKPYIARVTEMEMNTEHEELIIEEGDGEQDSVEEISPEDDLSSHGTFDAETNSELSFTAPTPGEVPTSDRVLRPRKHVDYHRLENPGAFELFAILDSNSLEGTERLEPDTRVAMMLAALKHEDDCDSKKKVSKWLVEQCKAAEPRYVKELTVEIVEHERPAHLPESEALED